jgi:hypothetical protein
MHPEQLGREAQMPVYVPILGVGVRDPFMNRMEVAGIWCIRHRITLSDVLIRHNHHETYFVLAASHFRRASSKRLTNDGFACAQRLAP